ncbi:MULTISPECIES: hypothetical protein [Niastella]|uniref:Uncharacterized protein n=1 Tax=Niastella soli TaxID=2821487 RepID=A0ABS3YQD5_9BACT|nr:hypothetical protein [Niastella soli]MBO9200104.1 hypothetical protein [Niastella soli]
MQKHLRCAQEYVPAVEINNYFAAPNPTSFGRRSLGVGYLLPIDRDTRSVEHPTVFH